MISYHLRKPDADRPNAYFQDFKSVDTDDVGRLAKCATGFVWSPIVWTDGVRRQDHFLGVNWCVLDFDNGEMSLAEAERLFCDMVHFIGTTKSHQKDKAGLVCDRFRVAMRFEKPITSLAIYKYNMHKILARYPCDKACKDGARFFYPCSAITQMEADGYHVEIDEAVPEGFDKPRSFSAYKGAGILPPWAASQLMSVWPEHTRNTTIYRVAKDLAKVGMDVDEIEARIVSSPTYDGRVTRELLAEIRKAVTSGFRKACAEMTMDGGSGDGGRAE